MAHGQEKLGDVKGENSGVKTVVSVFCNQVHQNEADIRGGVSANASELPFMKEVMLLRLKLQAFGDDLGEQFANRV